LKDRKKVRTLISEYGCDESDFFSNETVIYRVATSGSVGRNLGVGKIAGSTKKAENPGKTPKCS